MSGGHYNYDCYKLSHLSEDILADVKKYEVGGKDDYGFEYSAIPTDILLAMTEIANKLESLSKAAHDIEWYMSGDYSDDTMRACINKWEKPL